MRPLRALLLQSGLYRGLLPDEGHMNPDNTEDSAHSFDSLRRLVQASDEQLRAQLHSVGAYDVDGYFQLLDEQYAQTLVQDVINAVIETRQPTGRVSVDTIVATIGHLHSPAIIQQCLHALSPYDQHRRWSDEGQQQPHVALCPLRLTQHLAREVFSSAHSQPADSVLHAITAAMPPPLVCEPSHLLGIAAALSSPPPAPVLYRYLPCHALPVDVAGRVRALFAVKERWTEAEMAAWMDDIAVLLPADSGCRAGGTDSAALLKHCRIVTEKDATGNKTIYYLSNAVHK